LKNADAHDRRFGEVRIPRKDTPMIISSITLPVARRPGRTIREGSGKILAALFLLPLVFLVAASTYVIVGWHGGDPPQRG